MPDPRSRLLAVVVVMLVGLGTPGCSLFPKLHLQPSTAIPECVLSPVVMPTANLLPSFGATADRILDSMVGRLQTIPEFNDCQRFPGPAAGSRGYDAPYAIFATKDLVGWSTLEQITHQTYGVAAVIYSWGGTYDPLHIRSGVNCLYMRLSSNTALPEAFVLQATGPVCIPIPPNLAGINYAGNVLSVQSVPPPTGVTFTERDYPTVARWQWNAAKRQYYIGIKCRATASTAEWCEVGNPDPPAIAFTVAGNASTVAALTVGAGTPAQRVVAIRGWYDEQPLAEARDSILSASSVIGTAFPAPGLDTLEIEHFRIGAWVPVAHVGLSDNHGTYSRKYGLVRARLGQPVNLNKLNKVELCRGTRAQCQVRPTLFCTLPTTDSGWWARFVSAPRSFFFPTITTYVCVDRRDHSSETFHIPGAVRWRWTSGDETLWVRCGQGCCEVDP